MKTKLCLLLYVSFFGILSAQGQTTFIIDQQTIGSVEGGGGVVPGNGQSFTPSLSAVQFFRLGIGDAGGGKGSGLIRVDLHADSLTGPLLGSTMPVSLPSLSGGKVDFFFLDPISLVPGNTYYFQPVDVTGYGGWGWTLMHFAYPYSGGTAIFNGVADPLRDFWFQEGILGVPKPSTWALILIGAGILFYVRHKRNQTSLS